MKSHISKLDDVAGDGPVKKLQLAEDEKARLKTKLNRQIQEIVDLRGKLRTLAAVRLEEESMLEGLSSEL